MIALSNKGVCSPSNIASTVILLLLNNIGIHPLKPLICLRHAYAGRIQLERARAATTITAAAFSPCGSFLVCASDSGRLAVWELSQHMASPGEDLCDTTPDMSWRADGSCINCLCFAGDLLLCGGDESLFGCSWAEIVSALERGAMPPRSLNSFSPGTGGGGDEVLRVRCPVGMTTRASARLPEINGISFDETTKRVLCAAGDGNAYEWDLESLTAANGNVPGGGGVVDRNGGGVLVRSYEGRKGYLHAVAGAPGSSLVATGSDDGFVGIWDKRVKSTGGANVAFLKPAHAQTGDGKESSPRGRGKPDLAECVTSLEMDGGNNTLVCGGRRTGGAVVAGGILEPTVGRGWVNQWSLTDLKATNVASLPAEVQCMCSTGQGQTLLTAGAESTVTYLSRNQLERKNRTPVTTSSVYALAINGTGPYEGVTCVAGVGPVVELHSSPGGASPCSLRFA
ncbi:unnamed protein product [Pylaiella littoralis]